MSAVGTTELLPLSLPADNSGPRINSMPVRPDSAAGQRSRRVGAECVGVGGQLGDVTGHQPVVRAVLRPGRGLTDQVRGQAEH
ncbi:hypothetical protein [Nocardia gipuzkoensis]